MPWPAPPPSSTSSPPASLLLGQRQLLGLQAAPLKVVGLLLLPGLGLLLLSLRVLGKARYGGR